MDNVELLVSFMDVMGFEVTLVELICECMTVCGNFVVFSVLSILELFILLVFKVWFVFCTT